jgi:hypothetical protein
LLILFASLPSRHVDTAGNLHSTRLLTLQGNLPAIFRPFVPVRCIYMLEHVVVNAEKQTMEVRTGNINLNSVVEAVSTSTYDPVEQNTTRYVIEISVKAFPRKEGGNGKSGYIASRLEKWAADKLLGNVSKGRQFIDAFCRQHVAMCEGKHQHAEEQQRQQGKAARTVMEAAERGGNGALARLLTLGWK